MNLTRNEMKYTNINDCVTKYQITSFSFFHYLYIFNQKKIETIHLLFLMYILIQFEII